MKKILLSLLVVLVVAVGVGAIFVYRESQKCTSDAYIELVTPVVEEWDDAVDIAESTARISLAPQIERLQKIRREADNLDVSVCATIAHANLVVHMDYMIDAFIAFMAQKEDDEISRQFSLAGSFLNRWESAVESIDS